MECGTCGIKKLIYQYAHHLDNGDLESLAAMFSRGRILATDAKGWSTDIVGAEAVHSHYTSFAYMYEDTGTPHTMHVTTNVMVEVEPGNATATAKSYALVFQGLADFPLQPVAGVRYHDTFARTDSTEGAGDWYFKTRRIELVLAGDLSRHLLQDI